MTHYFVITLLFFFSIVANANDEQHRDNENVLILDTSSYMQEEVAGETKMALLKQAFPTFIEQWSDEQSLSVLTYGQEDSQTCGAIQQLNTGKTLDKATLNDQVSQLTASGEAPLLSAIFRAKRLLTHRKGNIILVSNGVETCQKSVSICKAIQRMKHNHPNIVIHTIDMQGNNKLLRCITESTGGVYGKIEELKNLPSFLFNEIDQEHFDEDGNYIERKGRLVLQSVEKIGGNIVPASYIIYSDSGEYIGSYTSQERVEKNLPVGVYNITSIYKLFTQEVKLMVNQDKIVDYTFILGDSGKVNLTAKYRGKPARTLYTIYNDKGIELISDMTNRTFAQILPVGQYRIEAQYDGDTKEIELNVKNGSQRDIIIRF